MRFLVDELPAASSSQGEPLVAQDRHPHLIAVAAVAVPRMAQPALDAEAGLAIGRLRPQVLRVGIEPDPLHAQLAEAEVDHGVDGVGAEALAPASRFADGDAEGAAAVVAVDGEDIRAPDGHVVIELTDEEPEDVIGVAGDGRLVAMLAAGPADRQVAHQPPHAIVRVPVRDEIGIAWLKGPQVDALAAEAALGSVAHGTSVARRHLTIPGGALSDRRAAR